MRALLRLALLAAVLNGAAVAHAQEDNAALATEIDISIGIHNAALGPSFFPDPFVGIPAAAVTLATNLNLKFIPPILEIPPGWSAFPNTADQCHFRTRLPQSVSNYSNLLGLVNLRNVASDWGDFRRSGNVTVAHANTDVVLKLRGAGIRDDQTRPQEVLIPAGGQTYFWSARSQVSLLWDAIVPSALLGFNIGKYGAIWANPTASAASQTSRLSTANAVLVNAAVEAGLITASQSGLFDTLGTVSHDRSQRIVVYDVLPPTITASRSGFDFEATDFGGVVLSRVADELAASITAFDECDRQALVTNDAPVLFPVGDTVLRWTVRDLGPTPTADFNSRSLTQVIRVRDTQGPIVVPPPSRVIEVPAVESGISAAGISLGSPRVVDLADPQPRVTSDGPAFYPKDSRTPITWTATDASGNASTAAQLITVKTQGENTAPVVSDMAVSTLTSQPVDIILTGTDSDLIGGRFDPLNFRITQRPANGEFEAPLFPFFIEDYRTNPAGPYGEGFRLSPSRNNWMFNNVCRNNPLPLDERVALDWVYQPRFLHVTDDGTYFIIDRNWICTTSSTAETRQRISKWGSDGEYLGQIGYTGTNTTFVMDQDGLLYTLSRVGDGSTTALLLVQHRTNFEDGLQAADYQADSWRFNSASARNPALGLDDQISAATLSYARIDSRRGLIYVTDRRRVFVFDVRQNFADGVDTADFTMGDKYLGVLKNGEEFLNPNWNNIWTGYAMEVDPDGALYVSDPVANRVHKFSPSYFDESGEFVLGDYIGWLGRCDTSTNNACDETTGTSRGYACTDQTCTVLANRIVDGVQQPGSFGTDPGQFNAPEFVAIDPNGVLYVADAGDPNAGGRVQRFGVDGTFGGEARSTGTGINQGDRPGFVLGNLGTVKAVSVNSTSFFVVDQEESFVHVFETTPLKDITDDSATVTYVSNFAFHSDQDEFRYVASDGLVDSNVGRVFVNVARNFRPPEAFPQTVTTDEDVPLQITLTGDDPDGILGEDFNGLDTLTFRVVGQPGNGVVSGGSGATRTYTPNPDFFGEDSFTFVANDGREDSPEQTVNITVTPVNDPPTVLALNLPEQIGQGFPVVLRGEYVEDGAGSNTTLVEWGDGTTNIQGDYQDTPDGPVLVGIKLIEPPRRIGVGQAVGQHIYTRTGPRLIRYCMDDELNRPSCLERTVNVEALANLSVDLEVPELAVPSGATVNLLVTLTNHPMRNIPTRPGETPGVAALNATLEGRFSVPGVEVASTTSPACTARGAAGFSCAFGTLPPGQSRTFTVTLRGSSSLIYDVMPLLSMRARTSAPAFNAGSERYVAISSAADSTDSDGDGMSDAFERAYGFNPADPADAAADADGDGLSNLEEFIQRTNPLLADTDGDGLPDGFEIANGLNPLDGSDCPSWICGSGLSGWRTALPGAASQ
jgi:hypothetical protein